MAGRLWPSHLFAISASRLRRSAAQAAKNASPHSAGSSACCEATVGGFDAAPAVGSGVLAGVALAALFASRSEISPGAAERLRRMPATVARVVSSTTSMRRCASSAYCRFSSSVWVARST